jgi:hypothetical protein
MRLICRSFLHTSTNTLCLPEKEVKKIVDFMPEQAYIVSSNKKAPTLFQQNQGLKPSQPKPQ